MNCGSAFALFLLVATLSIGIGAGLGAILGQHSAAAAAERSERRLLKSRLANSTASRQRHGPRRGRVTVLHLQRKLQSPAVNTPPCATMSQTSRCLALRNFTPVDTFPTRSPLIVADHLIPLVRGKTFVEIGTRNGDLFECVQNFAKRSYAIEMDRPYCAMLRARGHSVICEQLNASNAARILPWTPHDDHLGGRLGGKARPLVFFWWHFYKYNLDRVALIDRVLKERGESAEVIFMLTGALSVEIADVHRSLHTIRSRKYAHTGSMRRLWFVEQPAGWEPARFPQVFKGPDAQWGVFHMMHVRVGVHEGYAQGRIQGQIKGQAPGPKIASRQASKLAQAPARTAAREGRSAPETPPSTVAPSTIALGRGRCDEWPTGESECAASSSSALTRHYPFRSPLVVADWLRRTVTSGPVATLGDADEDLLRCLPHGGRIFGASREDCLRVASTSLAGVRGVVCMPGRSVDWEDASNVHTWYVHDALLGAYFPPTRQGRDDKAPPAFRLVRLLDRLLRANGRNRSATVHIGIDGYSIRSNMKLMLSLLAPWRPTVTRLAFDEGRSSEQHPAAFTAPQEVGRAANVLSVGAQQGSGAHRGRAGAGESELKLLEALVSPRGGLPGGWRRYGVWHLVTVEVGMKRAGLSL